MSVSVRVGPSEDLKKLSSFCHLFDEELESVQPHQPLQSCFWLLKDCACVEVLLPCRRKCSRCHSFCFWQVGILGDGHSVCSTLVLLASSSACFSNVHVLLSYGRSVPFDPFAIRSPSLTFLWSYLLTEDVVDIVHRPDIDQGKTGFCPFPLRYKTLQPIGFPLGFPVLNTMRSLHSILKSIHDGFENLFLDSVTCSWICLSTCATCVSKSVA